MYSWENLSRHTHEDFFQSHLSFSFSLKSRKEFMTWRWEGNDSMVTDSVLLSPCNNNLTLVLTGCKTLTLTSFSAAVFSTNLEPWPGLPGQWTVIPGKRKAFCLIQLHLHHHSEIMSSDKMEVLYCKYFILTPGVPLSIKHSEGLARVGQTYRSQTYKTLSTSVSCRGGYTFIQEEWTIWM